MSDAEKLNEKLLRFLESQKLHKKGTTKKPIIEKLETKKSKPQQKQKSEKVYDKLIDNNKKISNKAAVKAATKKLIEQSKISSKQSIARQESRGFDVQRFEKLMKEKLIVEDERYQSFERPYVSVTELCGCLRKAYYLRVKMPTNINQQFKFPYVSLIHKVGNSVHDYVQDLYGFEETEKTVTSDKYKVKGRVDAISKNFLIELKTIDDKKFDGKCADNHYNQALIYSYILNTEYNYKIDTITIVYITRSLKRVYPFDRKLNIKLAESFLDNALLLHDCVRRRRVPDAINASEEQCAFCAYKRFCDGDGGRPKFRKDNKGKPVFLL